MDGVEHSRSRTPHTATEMMEIENLIRYTELAVGLMDFEKIFRYTRHHQDLVIYYFCTI
jgi:hypothetical protein